MIISVIVFLLILSVLVIIHELGHFLAAKSVGVEVEEFGIGYPPRAAKLFKKGGTLFSLNWIPFGGFVKIFGETRELVDKSKSQIPFYEKSALSRLWVIVAGPFANIILGILCFSIAYSFVGIPTSLQDQARIAVVAPDSPAEAAGVPSNVAIIAVEAQGKRKPITSIDNAIETIAAYSGQEITLITSGLCKQDSCEELLQEFSVYIRSQEELANVENQGALGVAFQSHYLKFYPWYEMPFRATVTGVSETLFLIRMTFIGLSDMLSGLFTAGKVPGDILGPVGIVHQASAMGIFNEGFLATLHFAGLLSTSLAVMNILPIPALDGGRAMFIMLEPLVGKKRLGKIEDTFNYGGFALLVGLLVLVTIRDIWRIFA